MLEGIEFFFLRKKTNTKKFSTQKDFPETQSFVPLPNVVGDVFKKVVEYCTWHFENPTVVPEEKKEEKATDDICEWDRKFCEVDQVTIFNLVLAANYLDNKPLLDLGCKTIANMIKGKTPEEVRKTFNIKQDFTPEEEEQIRKENDWCDEK